MPDGSCLPWTDEQWATVQRVVQESARKARIASSFLPLVGPLPNGQASVPALAMTEPEFQVGERVRGEAPQRLDIDDGDTLKLVTIACEVYLRTQQAEDPDLMSAKQMLGRAADLIGRLEDALVFRGQPGPDTPPTANDKPIVVPEVYTVRGGGQYSGLLDAATMLTVKRDPREGTVDSGSLVSEIVNAVQALEKAGHYGPFACVLGSELFTAANMPSGSLVLPSDRIVPFLDGGPLRRSSVVPDNQGVVVALAGSPIDLVVASDVHVKFLQLSLEPRYVLRVSERFVLRIKQPGARCRLEAQPRGAAA